MTEEKPLEGSAGWGGFQAERNECKLPGLASLQVRCPSNRIEHSFPINLVLECDETYIAIDRTPTLIDRLKSSGSFITVEQPEHVRLRVRLRHCCIRYICKNAEIESGSKYRTTYHIADSPATLSTPLDWGTKYSRSTKTTHHVLFDAKSSRKEVYEIEAIPGGWRVGDRVRGDPRKPEGCLYGPYFQTSVDGKLHTCTVTFDDPLDTAMLTFSVTVRDGFLIDRQGAVASGADLDRGISLMKDKLAAIRLERAIEGAEREFETDLWGETTILEIGSTCTPSTLIDWSEAEND